jgi:hypothetical protein
MRMNRGSLVLIAGLLLGACGGDDSNAKFSSGLDPSKTPATLSPAERAALCGKVDSFLPSVMSKADLCKISGMMGAMFGMMGGGDLKALCTAAYDACMNEPTEPTDPSDTESCSQGMSTCTATIGEIETCLNDIASTTQAEMAKIPSCSQITASSLTSVATSTSTSTNPASCTALEAKCPDMGETASAPMSH